MKRLIAMAGFALACLSTAHSAGAATPIHVDQGVNWTATTSNLFYTQDQGSQVMPLKWFQALKQANGQAFAINNLDRYGYLANPNSPVAGLPVGFSTNLDKSGETYVGLTCSGCHVRQITVGGQPYRIDGGPAITDFYAFLRDLDGAAANLLNKASVFDQFAADVLGAGNNPSTKAALHTSVQAWYLPFHTIVSRSLPPLPGWGPSRVDAVSMIFNRLSGLDIGTTAPFMIPENIALADAPARYPFLWNSHLQDITQWPGFSNNGSMLLALSRNLGEVYGVFAKLHPVASSATPTGIDFLQTNSANFKGLNQQEALVTKMGPPKWPFPLNAALVTAGRSVFFKKDTVNENKSCDDCHGIKQGAVRGTDFNTWATQILDVGTDSRESNLLGRQVKTGVLAGARLQPTDTPIQAVDSVFKLLKFTVAGSIRQFFTPPAAAAQATVQTATAAQVESKFATDLGGEANGRQVGTLEQLASSNRAAAAATPVYAYEARVLQGIWAAAPYLHNGSVPSLAQLLTPPAYRVKLFPVGPAYDVFAVGLSPIQTKFNFIYQTTGCSQRNSGNSNCGHEYGTGFSAAEKLALLEYLKQL